MTPDEIRAKARIEIPRHPTGHFTPTLRENGERTGERDLTLSREVRLIPGVLHIDGDMHQICEHPDCYAITVAVEASKDAKQATSILRAHTRRLNRGQPDAWGVFVLHRKDGSFRSARLVSWPGEADHTPCPGHRPMDGWDSFRAVMLDLQYIHERVCHPSDPTSARREYVARHVDRHGVPPKSAPGGACKC